MFKRIKLKSEVEDSNIKYSQIKSKFFLPGVLPIYATIPDKFKDGFEYDYRYLMESLYEVRNDNLYPNLRAFAKLYKVQSIIYNSFKEYIQPLMQQIDQLPSQAQADSG